MSEARPPRVFVAGHRGLAGAGILRELQGSGCELVTRTRKELDLADQTAVRAFFSEVRPDLVYLAAAKVGGILANSSFPAEFVHENLAIQTNVIHESWRSGVKRLVFLGSSCIYPRDCPQPIHEKYLLTGPLEATNRPYAVAKIAGIEMCWAYNRQYGTRFLCAMPTNLYGPGDHYDLETSHVLPALVRKFHEAKERGDSTVVVWGTGTPQRELMHVADMARACRFLMELPDESFEALAGSSADPPLINIGVGQDLSISDLASLVREVVGYQGAIEWDTSKPDGTPRKVLAVDRINRLGWSARIGLREGIADAYADFLATFSPPQPQRLRL